MLYGNNLRAVKESSLTSDPFSPILAQRISFLVSAGNNLSILSLTKFWRLLFNQININPSIKKYKSSVIYTSE